MYTRDGERGTTLLDVIVGSALMLVVFVGIFGAFQLAVDAVSNNKARAGAIALANERLEYIKSLGYDAIGTVGGIPSGAIPQSEISVLNDVHYTRRTYVSYEDDPEDGTGAADENDIIVDYKAVKTSVSWESRQGTRTVTMVTRISPPNGVEVDVPGGTVVIHAVDSTFQPIANAQTRLVNAGVNPAVDLITYTDETGTATVIGAPAGAGYQATVTKAGYSTAKTYGATATNTNPLPAHLGVGLYQTTAATFEIDLLADLEIRTFEAVEEETWTDTFADDSSIASTTGTEVVSGSVRLGGGAGSYDDEGTLISEAVSIPYILRWKQFSWDDTTPSATNIVYHVYDSSYNLIPNSDLPGNTVGFTTSPVDLTTISTSTYGLLRVGARLTTTDPSTTPEVHAWSVVYDVGPVPLPDFDFRMFGAKTIGSAQGGALIYKYDEDLSTDGNGLLQLENVEWDTYTMNVSPTTGYDIASSCPPQSIELAPASSTAVQLFLAPHTTNSLLVSVRASNGAVLTGASVRLHRDAYDTTITSDVCGQSFFGGLSSGTVGSGNPYSIEVGADGYTSYTSTEINVSGTTWLEAILN